MSGTEEVRDIAKAKVQGDFRENFGDVPCRELVLSVKFCEF